MGSASTWVAVGTVVFSALWTSGGQAAIQRRVIQHELDLAKGIGDLPLQGAMQKLAEDRATIYLARRRHPQTRAAWWILRGALLCVGLILYNIGVAVSGTWSNQAIDDGGLAVQLVGLVAAGGAIGAAFDEMFRDTRAWLGGVRVENARRLLGLPPMPAEATSEVVDEPPGAADGPPAPGGS